MLEPRTSVSSSVPSAEIFLFQVLADASREKAFTRSIEQDGRALFDERTDLVELRLGEFRGGGWMLFHVRHTSAPALRGAGGEHQPRSNERLPAPAVNRQWLPPAATAGFANGIALAPH